MIYFYEPTRHQVKLTSSRLFTLQATVVQSGFPKWTSAIKELLSQCHQHKSFFFKFNPLFIVFQSSFSLNGRVMFHGTSTSLK